MNADLDLSRTLTGVVSAVDGVDDVFPSGTIAQAATLTVINVVTDDETDDAKVAVSRDSAGRLAVTATIGVAAGHAAQTVLREVTDALRAALAGEAAATGPATIAVKASRIDSEAVPA